MAATELLPLPRGWTKTTRSSVLHAISLAFSALTRAWGSSGTSRRRTTRPQADLDRVTTEIALRDEELAIKDDRFARVPPRRRPHYGPIQRMRILKLKAARGWSLSQVAQAFAVTEETVASWLKRVDEEGERALVQLSGRVGSWRGDPQAGGVAVVRRLSPLAGASVPSVIPFPAPATSNGACGFPAHRSPARFVPRLMGPIGWGALSSEDSGSGCGSR